MILNKTTEYALRILAFMATRDEEVYAANYLFDELKIPRRYLMRLLTQMSKFGFITGTRGRRGGFIFARDLSEINLLEVIEALEGKEMNPCLLGFTACIVGHTCVMHKSWSEARMKVMETLSKTTLAMLRDRYKEAQSTTLLRQRKLK